MIFYKNTQDSMRIQVQFCNGVTILVSLWGHNTSFFRLNTSFLGKVFDYFSAFFFMHLLSLLRFSLFPYNNGLKCKLKDKKSYILPNQFCIALRNEAKILSRGNVDQEILAIGLKSNSRRGYK